MLTPCNVHPHSYCFYCKSYLGGTEGYKEYLSIVISIHNNAPVLLNLITTETATV